MKKFLMFLCAAVFVLGIAGVASAVPFEYIATDTPVAIPTLPVGGTSGMAFSIIIGEEDLKIVTDLNVYVDIDHTFTSDLDIYISHDGVHVQLFDNYGGGGADIQEVWFDDEATIPIAAGTPPFGPGYFIPLESLSAFDGMDLAGTWILSINDEWSDDAGSLESFKIAGDATAAPVPEPSTILLMGSGLLGLLGYNRKRFSKKS